MTGHGDSTGQAGRVHTSPDGAKTTDDVIVPILDAICTGDIVTLKANLRVPEHRSLKSPEGKTLLHVAAECGHPAIVAYLLESGWLFWAKMNDAETPLHFAARSRLLPAGFWSEPRTPWQPFEGKVSDAIELSILQLLRQRGMATPESIGAIDDLPSINRCESLSTTRRSRCLKAEKMIEQVPVFSVLSA